MNDNECRTYKIYKYTNKLDGKIYVGRTKNSLSDRAGKNGSKYLKLKHFGAAIRLYGWENFYGEILEDGLTYLEACDREQYYISKYEANKPSKGYNLNKGGAGPSKEALEKMRLSHLNHHLTEEHKKHISEGVGQGVNNCNYGRKHTEEACRHIGEAKKGEKHPNWGKHLSESTRKKIQEKVGNECLQYDLNGNFIREWRDAKQAATELNLNHKAINNCLRYLRHSSSGYKWEYKSEFLRNKYKDNKYILENFGIRAFTNKEELLKQRDKTVNN